MRQIEVVLTIDTFRISLYGSDIFFKIYNQFSNSETDRFPALSWLTKVQHYSGWAVPGRYRVANFQCNGITGTRIASIIVTL